MAPDWTTDTEERIMMEDVRPIITYQTDQISLEDIAIDIRIDRPFNGFFGTRLIVPTPSGTKDERAAKILEWVTDKVKQQVGPAADHVTFQAV
jgi:hypothetical protein